MVYNSILIVMNRFTKMKIYIFIKFIINVVDITKLLFHKIFLKFEFCENIELNKKNIHEQLLINYLLSFENQTLFQHCFSFANEQTNKKNKLNIETLFEIFLQFQIKQLNCNFVIDIIRV